MNRAYITHQWLSTEYIQKGCVTELVQIILLVLNK